jgi:hypothetical protein
VTIFKIDLFIKVLMILCFFKKHSTGATFCVICILVVITIFTVILSLFLSVWFIVVSEDNIFLLSFFSFHSEWKGNVWIFQVKSTVNLNDSTSSNYCHPTLYNFAFWILISSYIVAFVSSCLPCCIGFCCAGKLLKSSS